MNSSQDMSLKDEQDALYAVFGVLAQSGTARGPAPTEKELAEYVRGALDKKRNSEILSHIAFDPVVCALAASLAGARQANGDLADEAVVDAANRFERRAPMKSARFWGGISALAASILVAVFVWLPEAGQDSATQRVRVVQPQPGTSTVQAARTDVDLIRLGFTTGDAGDRDNDETNSDAFAANCQGDCARQFRLRRFGATLRAFDSECLESGVISAASRSRLNGLAQGPGAITDQPWREFVIDLQTAAKQSDEALCKVTARMAARLKN